MKLDEWKYAVSNLLHRRLRSFLSALSILIGIASIFALVSFGLGMQNYINVLADQMGTDKLFIMASSPGVPGTDDNFYLSEDDIDFVSKIKGVGEILGMYAKAGAIKSRKGVKYSFVIGYDPSNAEFIEQGFTISVDRGRQLKKGDSNKVLLGHNYQLDNEIFKRGLNLGDKVDVNDEQFEVVGFYEEVGNPQDDSQIYITDSRMETLYPTVAGRYGWVMLNAQKGVDPTDLADKIKEKLRKFKGQDEGKEDFFVQSFSDYIETFGNVLAVINGVLVLIALVSLFVATVNIMNTMYTAVIERTKEIGVMKAVGATNRSIMFVFMVESGLLGLVGGLVGVLLGYLIAKIGGYVAAVSGYSSLYPVFPWYLTFGCLAFAFFVGTIAGFLPARQASKLHPVDALRYE